MPILDVQLGGNARTTDGSVVPIPATFALLQRGPVVQVTVSVGLPIVVSAPRAVGAALKAQGLMVLIGRDVLQSCILVYNGPAGQFTLTL